MLRGREKRHGTLQVNRFYLSLRHSSFLCWIFREAIADTLLWGNPDLPNAPGSTGDTACLRSLRENPGPGKSGHGPAVIMIVRVNSSGAGAVWPPGCLTLQLFIKK